MKAKITAVYYNTKQVRSTPQCVSFRINDTLHTEELDHKLISKFKGDLLEAFVSLVKEGKTYKIVEVLNG